MDDWKEIATLGQILPVDPFLDDWRVLVNLYHFKILIFLLPISDVFVFNVKKIETRFLGLLCIRYL